MLPALCVSAPLPVVTVTVPPAAPTFAPSDTLVPVKFTVADVIAAFVVTPAADVRVNAEPENALVNVTGAESETYAAPVVESCKLSVFNCIGAAEVPIPVAPALKATVVP